MLQRSSESNFNLAIASMTAFSVTQDVFRARLVRVYNLLDGSVRDSGQIEDTSDVHDETEKRMRLQDCQRQGLLGTRSTCDVLLSFN